MPTQSFNELTHYEFCAIDFDGICKETQEFFSEYFSGAVLVNSTLSFSEFTEVSPDGIAFFMKKLFFAVFRQQLITVDVSNIENDMIMDISWSGVSLSETEMRKLRGIGKLSGFTVDFYEEKVSLRFYSKPLNVIYLYANSAHPLLDSYKRLFN